MHTWQILILDTWLFPLEFVLHNIMYVYISFFRQEFLEKPYVAFDSVWSTFQLAGIKALVMGFSRMHFSEKFL